MFIVYNRVIYIYNILLYFFLLTKPPALVHLSLLFIQITLFFIQYPELALAIFNFAFATCCCAFNFLNSAVDFCS